MKDRPPSSYGAVYVPPHHRLRSVISSPNYTSAALIDYKLREAKSAVLNPRASDVSYLPTQHQQQQEQVNSGNSHYNSACDDRISEEGSDCELESLSQTVRLFFLIVSPSLLIYVDFGFDFSCLAIVLKPVVYEV